MLHIPFMLSCSQEFPSCMTKEKNTHNKKTVAQPGSSKARHFLSFIRVICVRSWVLPHPHHPKKDFTLEVKFTFLPNTLTFRFSNSMFSCKACKLQQHSIKIAYSCWLIYHFHGRCCFPSSKVTNIVAKTKTGELQKTTELHLERVLKCVPMTIV